MIKKSDSLHEEGLSTNREKFTENVQKFEKNTKQRRKAPRIKSRSDNN